MNKNKFKKTFFALALFGSLFFLVAPAYAKDILPIYVQGKFNSENYEKKDNWYTNHNQPDAEAAYDAYGTVLPPGLMEHYDNSHASDIPTGCAALSDPTCQCSSGTGAPPLQENDIGGGC